MELERVECIWWDGYHNAFTDIVEFKGRYFVSFRHATEHSVVGRGEIYILRSDDLKEWKLIKKFPALADSRDPAFFVFNGVLGVFFLAFPDVTNQKPIDVYVSFSEDGERFSEPIKIDNATRWRLWRIRNYEDKLYAAGFEGCDFKDESDWGSHLFVSSDGKNFDRVSTIVDNEWANETDILFEGSTCYAIVRREHFQTPILAISTYPFTSWERISLNKVVQGPLIFKYKGEIFVAGRTYHYKKVHTSILRLDLSKGRVLDEIDLPSGGDTSYCGAFEKDGKIYLSYYSQHELDKRESKVGPEAAGIYLAVLKG